MAARHVVHGLLHAVQAGLVEAVPGFELEVSGRHDPTVDPPGRGDQVARQEQTTPVHWGDVPLPEAVLPPRSVAFGA
nr:hypothetical protein [Angustibacter aerolatus]